MSGTPDSAKIGMSRRTELAIAPVCFRPPVLGIEHFGFNPSSDADLLIGDDPESVLAGLRSTEAEALAQLLPCLMCGEESAVFVFYRAGRRTDNATSVARELLMQIASEEAVHEAMLSRLRMQLPVASNFEELRERSRQFFLQMSSKDPKTHFARIAALDSAVCKIMAALCGRNAHIRNCKIVHRIATKIRSDEAKHVRVSRQFIVDLGFPVSTLRDFNEIVSTDLVTLLSPIGSAFERLGVDSDRLFCRIKYEEEQKS